MQILVVMAQFLLIFFSHFFLENSETLKAHITGKEAEINKR